jgi:hypothetical protein
MNNWQKYLYLITVLIILNVSTCSCVFAVNQSGRKTQVTADIPSRYNIRLFGYTAPNAIVQANGIRTFAQVLSDKTGYFLIDPLPVADEALEICLITIDAERRSGFPFCHKLPDTDKPSEIGPILLAPTLSLSKGLIWQKQTAEASGQTIPNAKVDISFFETQQTASSNTEAFFRTLSKFFNLEVEAKGIPIISAESDEKGNFSVNMPNYKALTYRIFAKAYFDNSPTLKSQTLVFRVNPYFDYWWKYIFPKIIFFLIFILLLVYLVYMEAKTKKLRRVLIRFNEKKLRPFGVRAHLRFQRLLYNFQEYLRSDQK